MGTRNLTVVKLNKEYKVAQYGQYDGYPRYTGINILNFLRTVDIEKFKKKLEKCRFIADDEVDEINKKLDLIYNKKSPLTKKEEFLLDLFRINTGSEILNIIYTTKYKTILLENSIEFANDSVFCEWAYVIDLDKNTFEVYKGFNKVPLTKKDRFYNNNVVDDEYYPVKLVKSYKLNKLPSTEDFVSSFE